MIKVFQSIIFFITCTNIQATDLQEFNKNNTGFSSNHSYNNINVIDNLPIIISEHQKISRDNPFHLFALPYYGSVSQVFQQAFEILSYGEAFSIKCNFISSNSTTYPYQTLNVNFLSRLQSSKPNEIIKAKSLKYNLEENWYESYSNYETEEFCDISVNQYKELTDHLIQGFGFQLLVGYPISASWTFQSNMIPYSSHIKGLFCHLDVNENYKDFMKDLGLSPLSNEIQYNTLTKKLNSAPDFFKITLSEKLG